MNKVSPGENGFERKTLRTRKHEPLDEMSLMMPWGELVFLMAPHAPAPALATGTPRWRLIAYWRPLHNSVLDLMVMGCRFESNSAVITC